MQTGYTFGVEDLNLTPGARVFLVGADIRRSRYKTLEETWDLQDSMDELERLCETAGLVVLGRDMQSMQNPSPSTFIGAGKVEQVARKLKRLGDVAFVVFDDELSPAQGRNLQKAWGGEDGKSEVVVLDRTQLILQIFAQRARTKEAKLQVQAAQMRYLMPRLATFMTTGAGMDAKGGGSGGGKGGGGLKGAGETQLEMDRRLLKRQIGKVEEEMEEIRSQRDKYRAKRRERDNLPMVALVGYTNAGKSTMLNKLCGTEEVYADDLLFATLDPTTRKVRLPGGKEVLLTDTVGFIQKLPTKLVSSFRATLEELEDASLVVHVVDGSSPLARQQVWSVQNIIEELMVEDTPQILVLNKCDKPRMEKDTGRSMAELSEENEADPEGFLEDEWDESGGSEVMRSEDGEVEDWLGDEDDGITEVSKQVGTLELDSPDWAEVHRRVVPETVLRTSARTGEGIPELLQVIEQALLALTALVECHLPYSAGDILAEIHKVGTVLEEEFLADGTRVRAYVPPSLRNKLQQYVVATTGESVD